MATNVVRECSVEGCGRPFLARGFCVVHYSRARKDGSLGLLSARERFESRVDRDGPAVEGRPDLGRCWVWLGELNNQGYGVMADNGRVLAHRWSCAHFSSAIPDGYVVDHLCSLTCCVNPAHLEPVTQRENASRGQGVAAINARKTHCGNGHEYTEENTLRNSKGHRSCLACRDAKRLYLQSIRVLRKQPQGEPHATRQDDRSQEGSRTPEAEDVL